MTEVFNENIRTKGTSSYGETAGVISADLGEIYKDLLRSLGVCDEDAATSATYLTDPDALAQRSAVEKTVERGERVLSQRSQGVLPEYKSYDQSGWAEQTSGINAVHAAEMAVEHSQSARLVPIGQTRELYSVRRRG